MSLLSRRGEKKINTYENTEGGLGTARKQKKRDKTENGKTKGKEGVARKIEEEGRRGLQRKSSSAHNNEQSENKTS